MDRRKEDRHRIIPWGPKAVRFLDKGRRRKPEGRFLDKERWRTQEGRHLRERASLDPEGETSSLERLEDGRIPSGVQRTGRRR